MSDDHLPRPPRALVGAVMASADVDPRTAEKALDLGPRACHGRVRDRVTEAIAENDDATAYVERRRQERIARTRKKISAAIERHGMPAVQDALLTSETFIRYFLDGGFPEVAVRRMERELRALDVLDAEADVAMVEGRK